MFWDTIRFLVFKGNSEEVRKIFQILVPFVTVVLLCCFLFEITVLVLHSFSLDLPLAIVDKLDQIVDKITRLIES